VLLNLKEILSDARKNEYAVFATNAFNFDSAEAIIHAAEETQSSVVLMVSQPLFKFFNFEKLMTPLISLAKDASVPVAVNLDHGTNMGIIMKCIDAGVSSVMFDGSSLPLEKNIQITGELTKIAHAKGVSVEGEVGVVGGLEGSFVNEDHASRKNNFTKTEDAEKFVEETGVDALAIAVGTVHGVFASKPDIDYERITEIRRAVETPLVLHGCSGLSDDDFRKVIRNGVNKINYFTNLVTEATRAAKEEINGATEVNYLDVNMHAMEAIKDMIKGIMYVIGSAGKGRLRY
jgi:fructose-bisphosphate aldolase, class II